MSPRRLSTALRRPLAPAERDTAARYHIRPAVLGDVPGIRACNKLSLPENYNTRFLELYVKRWPRLSLVALDADDTLVAYTLGRVGDVNDHTYAASETGFLTSIAVLPECRKLGVGNVLMQTLHDNMVSAHQLRSVSLHCRDSNQQAIRFYMSLGYKIDEVLESYYEDRGTALLMKKDFLL